MFEKGAYPVSLCISVIPMAQNWPLVECCMPPFSYSAPETPTYRRDVVDIVADNFSKCCFPNFPYYGVLGKGLLDIPSFGDVLQSDRHLKGTQSAMGPRWPGHYFSRLKSVYLNSKWKVRVGYFKKSASILPSVSFDPRSFTENLFLRKL